jgi:hypothetical protein
MDDLGPLKIRGQQRPSRTFPGRGGARDFYRVLSHFRGWPGLNRIFEIENLYKAGFLILKSVPHCTNRYFSERVRIFANVISATSCRQHSDTVVAIQKLLSQVGDGKALICRLDSGIVELPHTVENGPWPLRNWRRSAQCLSQPGNISMMPADEYKLARVGTVCKQFTGERGVVAVRIVGIDLQLQSQGQRRDRFGRAIAVCRRLRRKQKIGCTKSGRDIRCERPRSLVTSGRQIWPVGWTIR